MALGNIFDIAGTGMNAQSLRLNTTASNLANAQSASSSVDEVYRSRQPVFAAMHQNAMREAAVEGEYSNNELDAAAGVKVLLDDFGTGYSSLSYLHEFQLDVLKIDRSFIMDMASSDSDMMIVKTMITLAHGLGKRILAEGVEDPNQLLLLKHMACDAAQGYLIAKPLPETDALALLQQKLSF